MRTMMPRRMLKKMRLRIDMWADESSDSESESESEILRKPELEHEGSARSDVVNASDEEASEDASTSNASAVSATVKQGDNAGLMIAANVETNHAVDSPEMGINQEDINAEDDEDDWTALCQDIEENINKSAAAAAAAATAAGSEKGNILTSLPPSDRKFVDHALQIYKNIQPNSAQAAQEIREEEKLAAEISKIEEDKEAPSSNGLCDNEKRQNTSDQFEKTGGNKQDDVPKTTKNLPKLYAAEMLYPTNIQSSEQRIVFEVLVPRVDPSVADSSFGLHIHEDSTDDEGWTAIKRNGSVNPYLLVGDRILIVNGELMFAFGKDSAKLCPKPFSYVAANIRDTLSGYPVKLSISRRIDRPSYAGNHFVAHAALNTGSFEQKQQQQMQHQPRSETRNGAKNNKDTYKDIEKSRIDIAAYHDKARSDLNPLQRKTKRTAPDLLESDSENDAHCDHDLNLAPSDACSHATKPTGDRCTETAPEEPVCQLGMLEQYRNESGELVGFAWERT